MKSVINMFAYLNCPKNRVYILLPSCRHVVVKKPDLSSALIKFTANYNQLTWFIDSGPGQAWANTPDGKTVIMAFNDSGDLKHNKALFKELNAGTLLWGYEQSDDHHFAMSGLVGL